MQLVISSGHGKYIRGASGYIDEVDEARRVVDRTAQILNGSGNTVKTFHDNTSHDQSTNLSTIVNYHNSQSRELDVSVHFNAYQTTSNPMGCEVLYVTQSSLADKVSEAIADAGDFIDRGPKKRTDLYFLNKTHEPSILLEVCFVDSKADTNLYHQNFEKICTAIAESITGQSIGTPPPDVEVPPPDVEVPPATSTPGIVSDVPQGDGLNIRASGSGSAPVIGVAYNGDPLTIVGQSGSWYKCQFSTKPAVYGWASMDYITVQGSVPTAGWHNEITATVFGVGSDAQEGAYGNYIDGNTKGVALPFKWRSGPRPTVVVSGPRGEYTTGVVDVGPWNIDDPNYVNGTARPLSESQYKNRTQAQNGQVPSNDAGIDLTGPVADAVGISGKGKVNWRYAT
jgi:N-acetylmuramoyl-L-alanine amidase